MANVDDAIKSPSTPPGRAKRRGGFPSIGRHKPAHILMAAGLYVFFAVFLIWPIVQIVATGFTRGDGRLTGEYVALIFRDPLLVRGLINAAIVAVCVTTATALISLPMAVLTVRYEFPLRKLMSGLLLAPLVLPPFVGAIGVRMALGRYGPVSRMVGAGPLGIDWMGHYRLAGIVIVEALGLYPIMLLNLQAALANIDPAMTQAAANLGARRWTVFRRVTFPLVRPGLFAGCTLVMIWSFTELGTPLMFDYYTITPVQVFKQITDVASNPLAYALVVVMLTASAALYVVGKALLGRPYDTASTRASIAATAAPLGGWKAALALSAVGGVVLLAALPHIAVIITSFSAVGGWYKSILPAHWTLNHYRAALVDEIALPSVLNSIKYAGGAMCVALAVGLCAAIVIVRSNLPGRGIIDSLCMLPLAAPGLVLAFGYLAIGVSIKRRFGEHTWKFLNVVEYPTFMLIVAYAARRLPYVVRSAVAGLQQTPRDLELAAANLGAGKWTVFWKITLPLIAANLIAGALLAFAFAMLEVSDSLILAQRVSFYPITKAILDLSQRLGDGLYIASALGVWAMVLLMLTILAASSMLGKKMGTLFRV
ncbi:MAG TPA: iron ABC transporter permease [Tepidisphaeraceae bacterium]|jgi:iron(III) transport system permease protein|nr:iron ABC transporter permease [Tepidisphaeraceae bacterium]